MRLLVEIKQFAEIFNRSTILCQITSNAHKDHINGKASNQLTLNIDYRKLGVRIKPKGEKGYTPMSDEANHMRRAGLKAVVAANTGQNRKKPLDNY